MKQRFAKIKAFLSRSVPGWLRWIYGVVTRRLWLKLISLVIALIVWTYIISNTSSLTTTKMLRGLPVTAPVTGTLSSSLAVATDFTAVYSDSITVTVDVPQNYYANLSSRNVKVTPDYSGIRAAGTYDVPLIATSTQGTVTRISPATISVVIDEQDSCQFPLEMELVNVDNSNYWYDTAGAVMMLEQVDVSGPSSLVQSVDRVVAYMDMSGNSGKVDRSYRIVLLDENGEQINSRLLKKTNSMNGSLLSRCRVKMDVFPKKLLHVSVTASQLNVADGYRIDYISFTPASVYVAGPAEILDQYEELRFMPSSDVVLTPANNTMEGTLYGLDNFVYKSAGKVSMTVTLSQIPEVEDHE